MVQFLSIGVSNFIFLLVFITVFLQKMNISIIRLLKKTMKNLKLFQELTQLEMRMTKDKDNALVAASKKKGVDRQSEKETKKDGHHPQMQFVDKTRMEKAKKKKKKQYGF
ncbi:unnamed protein product [Amaranthus hypochondriacus]